jgi:hypothetical protein
MACGFDAEIKIIQHLSLRGVSRFAPSLVLVFALSLSPKHILLCHGFCIRKIRAKPSARKTSQTGNVVRN